MPKNCIKIQDIIQNKENGTPRIKGYTLFPNPKAGNINKINIKRLNNIKYVSFFFFLFTFNIYLFHNSSRNNKKYNLKI